MGGDGNAEPRFQSVLMVDKWCVERTLHCERWEPKKIARVCVIATPKQEKTVECTTQSVRVDRIVGRILYKWTVNIKNRTKPNQSAKESQAAKRKQSKSILKISHIRKWSGIATAAYTNHGLNTYMSPLFSTARQFPATRQRALWMGVGSYK